MERRGLGDIFDSLMLRGDVDSVASVSVRQLLGSGVTTVFDVALFYALVRLQVLGILASAAVSFCFALVMNYLIASCYVFRHRAGGRVWQTGRFVLYCFAALASLALSQTIIWLLSVRLSLHPLLGKGTSVVALFFWNQWIARRVIFNGKVAEKTSGAD